MTNSLRLVFLAASLLGSLACAAPRGDTAVSREHRAALDAYRAATIRAYLDAKPDGIVRHLSESVRLLPAYQKTVLGQADAANCYQAFLKRFAVSAYERRPIEVADILELAALQKLLDSTIVQHDGKTWALFYADDAILLANHGGVVSERKALDEYTVEHANTFPVFEKLDLRTHRIDDLGEHVIEYASGIANWRVGESSGVSLGKNILVWRRESGGTLKIWRAISMYD